MRIFAVILTCLVIAACAGPVTRTQVQCRGEYALVVVHIEDQVECEAYMCHRGQDCVWISTGVNACTGWVGIP